MKTGCSILTLALMLVSGIFWSFEFQLAHAHDPAFWSAESVIGGVGFVCALIAILVSHELGHITYCTKHVVRYRGPYLLPVPLPLTGTIGTALILEAQPTTRRARFDCAIAGPLAGLAMSAFLILVGAFASFVVPVDPSAAHLPTPIALNLFTGPGEALSLHPVAAAGWLGLLITAVNLVPLWPFDGGQIVAALWPRLVKPCAVVVFAGLGAWAWGSWPGRVSLAVALLAWIVSQPPVAVPVETLGRGRWAVVAIAGASGFLCVPL